MYEGIEKTIGKKIRCARDKKGWTVFWLSKAIGYSEKTVRNVESGANQPSLILLLRICDVLGIAVSELLCDSQEKSFENKRITTRNKPADITRQVVGWHKSEAHCPNCGAKVYRTRIAQESNNFCHRCGQALGWY